ncbi:MAG: hypothetical protein GY698_25065, partial [Actinomycetia bacterium]|nr:hypothetical protein [Actinomycetes bacterium]
MARTRLLAGVLASAVMGAACAPIASVDDAGPETLIATGGAPALPVAAAPTTLPPTTLAPTTLAPTTLAPTT